MSLQLLTIWGATLNHFLKTSQTNSKDFTHRIGLGFGLIRFFQLMRQIIYNGINVEGYDFFLGLRI